MNLQTLRDKRYRVLEVRTDNGDTTFVPQWRYLITVWQEIMKPEYTYTREAFESLDEANEFLYKLCQTARRNKPYKKAHEFNEVFHKLQK